MSQVVSWALTRDTIIYKTELFSALVEHVFTLFLFMEPRYGLQLSLNTAFKAATK